MEGLWNISPKWGLKFTGDGRRHEAIPSEPSNLLTTRVILLILTLKILKRQGATIIVRRIEISGLRRGRRQGFKGTRVRILHWSKLLRPLFINHFVYILFLSPILHWRRGNCYPFWWSANQRPFNFEGPLRLGRWKEFVFLRLVFEWNLTASWKSAWDRYRIWSESEAGL